MRADSYSVALQGNCIGGTFGSNVIVESAKGGTVTLTGTLIAPVPLSLKR